MYMEHTIAAVFAYGLVPVIKLDDAEKAIPLADALRRGGLPIAEVTFRTTAAVEAISRITATFPEMLVGAGTVLTPAQADEAVAAGAQFIVSPGLNPRVVRHCVEKKIPIFPGCATPSDLEAAIEFGLSAVKFFPAEASGGVKAIRAMSAPYPQLRFLPTGGINEQNLVEYLACPNVIACGGSFMVKDTLIAAEAFDTITGLTHRAVSAVMGFSLGHIGLSCHNSSEALRTAELLQSMFGFPVMERSRSISVGPVEFLTDRTSAGHVAIGVRDLSRATAYFTQRGFTLKQDKYDAPDGVATAVFQDPIGGLSWLLVQNETTGTPTFLGKSKNI